MVVATAVHDSVAEFVVINVAVNAVGGKSQRGVVQFTDVSE